MSGLAGLARRMGQVPRLIRTVRPLRFEQALAQIRHAFVGVGVPRSIGDAGVALALRAPAVAFLPPPAHVRRLGPERFELLATAFDVPNGPDWARTDHGPLFAYHLHQHEWLRCPGVEPERRAAVLLDWIRSNRAGVGWDPHPIGLRLLAWGKLMTTAGSLPDDPALLDALVRAFADQAETLSQGLEIRLQANHLLSNLICVVFAGLLIEGSPSAAWRGRADRLVEELARQVHGDGGHEERSPMYHAALEEGLLDLLNLCRARPERAPAGLVPALEAAIGRMQRALEILSHGDGRIALFADAAFDVAPEPRALRDYAARLGVPLATPDAFAGSARLEQTGYVRLERGEWLLIASVAGPAPAHQPGHAHCDALAFELSVAGRRLVTDTGVFEYRAGPRRERSRATASHATIQIDEEEQAEVWSAHRVGGRPIVALHAGGDGGAAEATCRGWSRPQTTHRRRYRVGETGVEIEDAVEGPTRILHARLPLEPGWSVELRSVDPGEAGEPGKAARDGAHPGDAPSSRASAFCRHREDPALRVEIELPAELDWHVEQGAYHPSFGREVARPILVGVGRACAAARTRIRRIR